MKDENKCGTTPGENDGVQYVLSAEELKSIIGKALDERSPRGTQEDAGAPATKHISGFGEEGEYAIDAKMAIAALAKRWWIILLATLLGGFIMLGVSWYNYTPQYQATIKLYVNNTSSSTSVTVISTSDIAAAQTLIPTYDQILHTRSFLNQVSSEYATSGKQVNITQLSDMLSSGAMGDTQLYYVTVTAEEPEQAYKLANIIYDKLPAFLKSTVTGSNVVPIDNAGTTVTPVQPDFFSKVLVGAAVGLVLSVLYSILVGCVLNDAVDGAAWLSSAFPSVPVLAQIPDTGHGGRGNHDVYGYGYGYGYGYDYGYGYSYSRPKTDKAGGKKSTHKKNTEDTVAADANSVTTAAATTTATAEEKGEDK